MRIGYAILGLFFAVMLIYKALTESDKEEIFQFFTMMMLCLIAFKLTQETNVNKS